MNIHFIFIHPEVIKNLGINKDYNDKLCLFSPELYVTVKC